MVKKIKNVFLAITSLASVFFFYWKGYQKGTKKASQRAQKAHQNLMNKLENKEIEKLNVSKENVVAKLNTRFNPK